MLKLDLKYSYNDISIKPAAISTIKHRSECNPFYDEMLPIFTAPMSAVIDDRNYNIFKDNKVIPIIPRNINIFIRKELLIKGEWVALGLEEFHNLFIREPLDNNLPYKVCIDIANGHMKSLLDLVKKVKKTFHNITIMTGNIANPETIEYYIEAGVDYVRLGIGTGEACITSSNVGIHYPIASLIDETVQRQKVYLYNHPKYNPVKLIADGGIRNYSDVIKALALGADYVMIGGLFAQCEESCGEIIEKAGNKLYHQFYGMASAKGQIDLQGKKTKTSEGICKEIEITTTLPQWTSNMIAYIRSAMSYVGAVDLKSFINTSCIVISTHTKQSINI